MKTPHRALAGVTVLTLALAGCGGADPATGTSSSPSTTSSSPAPVSTSDATPVTGGVSAAHNDADVTFVLMMIEHHRGAVAIAQLAPDRAADPKVTELAAAIEAAQTPEIGQMTAMLQAWDAARMPGGDPSHGMDMDGHDSGADRGGTTAAGSAMPGMMTAEQMAALTAATGPDFDRMFLELMIAHHEGAVRMSAAEIADGGNPQAIALARSISDAQTAEIARMRELLAQR